MKSTLKEFKKWDTHHHINPPFYEEAVKKNGFDKVFGLNHPKWSPKKMFRWMDETNMERAVMSISTPGVHFGNDKESRKLCRRINNYMADLVKQYPKRLGAFAVVPLPDVNGAVEELKYAMDELKMDGIGLLSNMNLHYLGDKSFEPFFEEANKRNAVIYIHPTAPELGIQYHLLNYVYYFKLDTTKTIIDFMKSGYHKKYGNIKFILSHGGGVLPAIFPIMLEALKAENPFIQEEFETWRGQLFGDTSLISYADEMLPTALKFFGANHIIFGSDLCWAVQKYKYFINGLMTLNVSQEMLEDIFMNNTKALFSGDKIQYKPFDIKPESESRKKSNVDYHVHCNPENVLKIVAEKVSDFQMDNVDVWEMKGSEETVNSKAISKAMVSLDIPELWKMNPSDIRKTIRLFNDTAFSIRKKNPRKIGVLGAIDFDDVDSALEEIDYCIDKLKLEGICLYVTIVGKAYENMFDQRLLKKLESLNVPVLIHPKASKGLPIFNENYLDSVAYIFSLLYEDHFDHLMKVNYIPSHTGGLIDFLSHPVNSMHYIDPITHKPRIGKVIWDMLILKKEVVHDHFKEMIIAK